MKAYPCPVRGANRQACRAPLVQPGLPVLPRSRRHQTGRCLHTHERPRVLSVLTLPPLELPVPSGILYQTIQ